MAGMVDQSELVTTILSAAAQGAPAVKLLATAMTDNELDALVSLGGLVVIVAFPVVVVVVWLAFWLRKRR